MKSNLQVPLHAMYPPIKSVVTMIRARQGAIRHLCASSKVQAQAWL